MGLCGCRGSPTFDQQRDALLGLIPWDEEPPAPDVAVDLLLGAPAVFQVTGPTKRPQSSKPPHHLLKRCSEWGWWLTLRSPTLWQAQGPQHPPPAPPPPCDTLLPKLNPPPLFSRPWCNRTSPPPLTRRTPILFSFPAIKHYAAAAAVAPAKKKKKAPGRFLRSTRAFISAAPRRGRNDQSLCAAGVAQFTAPPPYHAPAHPPSALAHHTLHGTQLVIVHTNYMSRCEEERNRHSVPVVRQINKCLMTRSAAPFST